VSSLLFACFLSSFLLLFFSSFFPCELPSPPRFPGPEAIIQSQREEIDEKNFEIETLKKDLEGLIFLRDQNKTRLELYEQSLATSETSLQSVTAQFRLAIDELGKKSLRIQELENDVQGLKGRRNSKTVSRPRLSSEEMSPEDEIKKLKTQLSIVEDKNRKQLLEIAQLRDFELSSAKAKIGSLEQQLDEKTRENDQLKLVEFASLKNRIIGLESQLAEHFVALQSPRVRLF